jgi:hypothetical protein
MAKSKPTTNARPKHSRTKDRVATRSNDDNNGEDDDIAVDSVPPPPPPSGAGKQSSNNNKKRKGSNDNDADLDLDRSTDGSAGAGAEREGAPPPPSREKGNDNGKDDPYCWIKLPKRPDLFPVSDTWWMVDLHARPVPKQGATPLVKRCMRELGWSEAKARTVLRAYRQFLRVKVATKDWNAELLSPSVAVDRMWHQHVLDNLNYAHDCLLLCDGHYVRHDPDGGLDTVARKSRLVATQQALLESFGEDDGEEGGALDTSAAGPWKDVFEGAAESDEDAGAADLSSGPAEDQAQASDDDSGLWVTLWFQTLTGGNTRLRVRRTATMGEVFVAYARHTGLGVSDCRFVCRGCRVEDDSVETPDTLGLQNGERVHVVSRARGC